MWRLVPVLKLALVLTWAQMGSCRGVGPAVAVFPGMPPFRANFVAPSVHSPPAAGKITHFIFTSLFPVIFVLLFNRKLNVSFFKDRLQGRHGRVRQLKVRGSVNVCAKRERSTWIRVMKRKTTKRNQRYRGYS